MLEDDAEEVVNAAAWALGEIGNQKSFQALATRFHQVGEASVVDLGLALVKIERSKARDLLFGALINSEGRRRDHIAKVINSYAYDLFEEGRVDSAAACFRSLIEELGEVGSIDTYRNDLAYCSMLLNDLKAAGAQLALLKSEEALWQHNRAILSILNGDSDSAKRLLREALFWVDEDPVGDESVSCMLLLEPSGTLRSVDNLPIGMASILNLFRVGDLSLEESLSRLERLYPHRRELWEDAFMTDGAARYVEA